MSDTKKFMLPDLGEGLPDATIVEWAVKVGDTIRLDDNLVSMETAKAVVDVPSPASLSAASSVSFTCAPQVTRVTSVPSRSTKHTSSGSASPSSGTSSLYWR